MRSDRGFGLLEVVLATGIVALVLGAVLSVLSVSARRADLAARRVTAMYLAGESLEQARALRDSAAQDDRNAHWTGVLPVQESGRFERRQDGTGFHWLFTASPAEEITLADGVTYKRTVMVAALPQVFGDQIGLPADNLSQIGRHIDVRVTWGTSVGESVRASTYLTDWRPGS